MRNLRGRPEIELLLAGEVLGQDAARLHRAWRQTLMIDFLRDDTIELILA